METSIQPFLELIRSHNGHGGGRASALGKLAGLRFPTRRDEDWRTTDIEPIVKTRYRFADPTRPAWAAAVARFRYAQISPIRLVFLNGHFSESLSDIPALPAGVSIRRTSARMTEPISNAIFPSLNAAGCKDGLDIHLQPGTQLADPIVCIFVTEGSDHPYLVMPRNRIVAEANSRARIIEVYAGQNDRPYFTNAVTNVTVDEGADIDHHKLQIESPGAYHIGHVWVEQKPASTFRSHLYSFGASIARNELRTTLDGEGVETTLNGVYLAKGTQHVDNRTMIDHARPHCHSWEVYKGILADRATGTFNGKIVVRPDAQKTDAKQSNHALLLSPDATIHSKPQLEIFADDVKCTHGATVGQLDEQMLFYMRTRGISKDRAQHLLTYAFAADVVSGIQIPALEDIVQEEILRRLAFTDITTANKE